MRTSRLFQLKALFGVTGVGGLGRAWVRGANVAYEHSPRGARLPA
jgi:hypothetical protein